MQKNKSQLIMVSITSMFVGLSPQVQAQGWWPGTSTPTKSTTTTTTTKPATTTTTTTAPTTTTTAPTSTTTTPTTTTSTTTTSPTTTTTTAALTTPTTTTTTTTITSSLVSAITTLGKNLIFSGTSFWYTPIPANAPLHPNSYNFVQEFLRQKAAYYGNVNINQNTYASPVFYADSSVPKVKVTEWDCQRKGYTDKTLATHWAQVPIPAHAVPAGGSDAEMTVYDLSTNTLYEFWRMQKVNGAWQACWGGRMQYTQSSPGYFPGYYGTTATSLPFLGGQITAEELKAGEIKHVIGISLVDIEDRSIFSWPAQRSDGVNPNKVPNRIPEGQRFRLDPTVNVDALPMTPAGKIIAKAAQKYGFVVWDRAGAISLRAQTPSSYTQLGLPNPYPEVFGGKQGYEILNGFPWSKLQFLPHNYGKPL